MNNYIFTSESVSDGHPDKVADQISDALVDAGLAVGDETTRVAVETLVTTNHVTLAGEVKNFNVSKQAVEEIVRSKVKEIGYEQYGFHWKKLKIYNEIHSQSADIALGTDDFGAGDQGIMFGYACNDNEAYLPAPIYYAHRLVEKQAELRKAGALPWLRPDAKSQVTLSYDKEGKPERIDAVVLSTQHDPDISQAEIHALVREHIIEAVLPKEWLHGETRFHINPTGQFIIGGPVGDAGLTGRKIIVDTYGGMARHGGGAFSGKDPSKVDRSAAYAARYVAKNIVAAGLAARVEIQVSYAIGVAEPTSISLNTFGTNQVDEAVIVRLVRDHFDLRPKGIIEMLDLKKPIYRKTASYGHFGRDDQGFPWELTDRAEELRKAV